MSRSTLTSQSLPIRHSQVGSIEVHQATCGRISRVTTMKNDLSARKDLDGPTALQWLRSHPLESLGLSPLILAEENYLVKI